jgi:hypothetical protein
MTKIKKYQKALYEATADICKPWALKYFCWLRRKGLTVGEASRALGIPLADAEDLQIRLAKFGLVFTDLTPEERQQAIDAAWAEHVDREEVAHV